MSLIRKYSQTQSVEFTEFTWELWKKNEKNHDVLNGKRENLVSFRLEDVFDLVSIIPKFRVWNGTFLKKF